MFGIPDVLKTDNGPAFNSDQFRKFAEYLGFRHRRITPLWPRANSEVERFMSNINKVIQTSMVEGRTWKLKLHRFLRNYRTTPHSTTWRSPAKLMFNRPLKTKLPEISHCSIHDDHVLRHRDYTAKQQQKLYSDQRRRARPSKEQEGD